MIDDDMRALYAYFIQGVAPVRQANRASEIPWPMNMRWPLKLWNLVFLDKAVYQPKKARDAVWNRGAYLVQGLGHCGACHTPRSPTLNEKALDESGHAFLSGAALEGWFASNLAGDHNTGLGRWSVEDLHGALQQALWNFERANRGARSTFLVEIPDLPVAELRPVHQEAEDAQIDFNRLPPLTICKPRATA